MSGKPDNKHLIPYILFLAVSFLAELFLFNYKHWQTLPNHEVFPGLITLGDAYIPNEDGTYSVGDGDYSIILPELDLDLRSVYFNVTVHGGDSTLPTVFSVYQYVTDAGHSFEYSLPVKDLWSNQPKSRYLIYHLYGNCTGLRFLPLLPAGSTVSMDIRLNPVIPLSFSLLRMTGLFFILCFLYLFRPSSPIYNIAYLKISAPLRAAMLAFLFLAHLAVFWKLAGLDPDCTWNIPEHHRQYQKLAESFREGFMALLEEPAEAFSSMVNPYDLDQREDILIRNNATYLWDTAYFDGKYYVYFGVVPVLLFYFPYHILTGGALPNHIAMFLALALLLLGIIGVLHESIKKWFPRLSLGAWFLTMETFLMGSNLIYMAKRPDMYSVPIATGLAMGMLGLWCFLRADEKDHISLKYLAAGAFLTALTAGCRPQLLLFMVFPVILFGRYLFSREFYRTKEGRRAVLAAAVPILAVAAFLMYYNQARFGSVFDFGASYNLTTNDMRYRGWAWGRIPFGIFVYLFQPVRLITKFPFVEALYTRSQYMGVTIQEYTPGGIFAAHLFPWLALPAIFLRKHFDNAHKVPCMISIGSLISALAILVADTEMAGILWRYYNDFSLFIMLAALLSVWILFSTKKMMKPYMKKWFTTLLLLCFVAEVMFQGMFFFVDTGHSLMETRPDLFSKAMYLIAFWM
ncbi:MAG: hypothetical protein NC121_01910 [Blautia sp.]|nr:hypothetical protein [Blautia sp.]